MKLLRNNESNESAELDQRLKDLGLDNTTSRQIIHHYTISVASINHTMNECAENIIKLSTGLNIQGDNLVHLLRHSNFNSFADRVRCLSSDDMIQKMQTIVKDVNENWEISRIHNKKCSQKEFSNAGFVVIYNILQDVSTQSTMDQKMQILQIYRDSLSQLKSIRNIQKNVIQYMKRDKETRQRNTKHDADVSNSAAQSHSKVKKGQQKRKADDDERGCVNNALQAPQISDADYAQDPNSNMRALAGHPIDPNDNDAINDGDDRGDRGGFAADNAYNANAERDECDDKDNDDTQSDDINVILGKLIDDSTFNAASSHVGDDDSNDNDCRLNDNDDDLDEKEESKKHKRRDRDDNELDDDQRKKRRKKGDADRQDVSKRGVSNEDHHPYRQDVGGDDVNQPFFILHQQQAIPPVQRTADSFCGNVANNNDNNNDNSNLTGEDKEVYILSLTLEPPALPHTSQHSDNNNNQQGEWNRGL